MRRLLPHIFIIVLSYFFLLKTPVLAQQCQEGCCDGGCCPASEELDYPVNHADINLDVRSYDKNIAGEKKLIDFQHPPDEQAMPPQLNTLIENTSRPAITSLNQVCIWDWRRERRGGPIGKPDDAPADFATLVGLQTNPGQAILVPYSGYDIGGGYNVIVLYATENSITLKYTAEDDMVYGYGIQLKNFAVDPALLQKYQELNAAGRQEFVALCAGFQIGTASGGEILVAVRDTGSFMDPRWTTNDWWQTDTSASKNTACPMGTIKLEGQNMSVLADPTRVRSQFSGETTKKITHTERTNRAEQPNSNSQTSVLADQTGLGSSLFSGKLILQPENAAGPEFPALTKLTSNMMQGFGALLTSDRLATSLFSKNRLQRQIFTTSYVRSPIAGLLGETEYICHDGTPTSDEDCAKHIVYTPTNWPNLVFGLTGLSCELMPANLIGEPELCGLFRYSLTETKDNWKAVKYNFIISKYLPSINAPDPDHVKPEFHKVAGILVNVLEEAINDFKTLITEIFHITFEVKIAGELPGGGYANRGATSVAAAMTPAKTYTDFAVTTRGTDLTAPYTPEVQFSPANDAQEPLSFKDQRLTRNYICSTMCGSTTDNRTKTGFSWLGPDAICPSCDAAAYYIPDPPLPKPSGLDDACHWDPAAGCNYYGCEINDPNPPPGEIFDEYRDKYDPNKPTCTVAANIGCGEGKDPVCESGRCNPNELGPKKDYNNVNGLCPQGWTFRDESGNIAEECNNVCHLGSFKANEDGGYGPCHYQNGDVCLRNDGGDKCGYVCNRLCC